MTTSKNGSQQGASGSEDPRRAAEAHALRQASQTTHFDAWMMRCWLVEAGLPYLTACEVQNQLCQREKKAGRMEFASGRWSVIHQDQPA